MKAIGLRRRLGQALLIAWALLALLPVANAIRVVREYAVDHVLVEEWYAMAPIAIAVHDGTFSLSQLFEPVNEHPIVLSKLILALHTGLTNFSQVFGQHLNLLMSLLLLLGVLWLLWQQNRMAALLAAPLLSLSALNLSQSVNWFIVHQNIFIISSLATLLIVLILQCAPVGWRALLGAIAVAFVGSFSMAIAPALWLAPLPTLWLRGYRNWRHYAAWLLGTALAVALTLSVSGLRELRIAAVIAHIGTFFKFLLVFLGNGFVAPLPESISLAIPVGGLDLILFILNAFLLWRYQPKLLASWAGIAAFGILAGLLTSYGRLFLSLSYALIPRYVTHSMFFWQALLAIVSINFVLWLKRLREHQRASTSESATVDGAAAKALLLTPGTVLSVAIVGLLLAIAQIDTKVPDFRYNYECMLTLPTTRDLDCATRLFAGAETSGQSLIVLTRIDQLAVRRLGAFANMPPVPIRSGPVAVPLNRLDFATHNYPVAFEINGQDHTVILQHPPAKVVWGGWFHHITVPTYLEAAIYVPPPEFLSLKALECEGVIFRVYLQAEGISGKELVVEERYDPMVHSAPIPVHISLEPYLNRRMMLQAFFETDVNSACPYEHALWVEPHIVMELTEEAAQAKYYPPQ